MFMLQNFSKTELNEEEKVEGENNGKLVDLVQWYGLFAPQSLKDAKERFVKGEVHRERERD
jgi:hypothetical protein